MVMARTPPSASRVTGPQGEADHITVSEPPERALRRLVPDAVQLEVMVGSLLGGARVVGVGGQRRLRVASTRTAYVRWKYERLGAFAAAPPVARGGVATLWTIAHPVIDDLARAGRPRLLELAGPIALAVWLADTGRADVRAPAVRAA